MNKAGSLANFYIVADDYGLSPGVSEAIRQLFEKRVLNGTGCMTLFPEWAEEAKALVPLIRDTDGEAGLHLTLTDFQPLTGQGPLGAGKLPPLGRLIKASFQRKINESAIAVELDAQLNAFEREFGHLPDFLDGHQHVHFLPSVRRWLISRVERFKAAGTMPWLRGAPSLAAASGLGMKTKVAFVSGLAVGFDEKMRAVGYPVKGPLKGFYDWNDASGFAPMLDKLMKKPEEGGVIMCHPGMVDDLLRKRDRLVQAREEEFSVLNSL